MTSPPKPVDEYGVDKAVDEDLNINTNLKKFFVGTASFEQHFKAQQENRRRYAAGMKVLEKNGVDISQSKSREREKERKREREKERKIDR